MEDSVKRLQAQNFLAQTVDPRAMYASRDLKDHQLVMHMSKRQILWRLTLSGIFRSKKFYILLTGLALNICAFVHWMYEIESPYARQQLNMLELFLRYVGIYTVIYFVFRKASKQLIDNAVWVRGLIPTFLLSLLLMLTLMIYLQLAFRSINDISQPLETREANLRHVACSSPIWLITSLFDFLTIILFYKFVDRLDIASKRHIEREKEIYGFREDHAVLDSRMKSLWLIIKVYLGMSFYQLVFTLLSFFWAIHIKNCKVEAHNTHHRYIKCNVITMQPAFDTWFWLFSRLCSYFLW